MTALFTILDGGQSLDITEQQVEALRNNDVIYFCDKDDCGFYHIDPSLDDDGWETVDRVLAGGEA